MDRIRIFVQSTQLLPGITSVEYLEPELKFTIGPFVADIRRYLGLVCQPYIFRILTPVDSTPTKQQPDF